MFQVYGRRSFDSSGNIFVIAEQCLHRAFSTPHTSPPVSSLRLHKKWEGTQSGQLLLSEQWRTSYNMSSCFEAKWGRIGNESTAQRLSGYKSVAVKLLICIACLLGCISFTIILIFIAICCCWWWLFYCIWIPKLMTSTIWILFIQSCWDRE